MGASQECENGERHKSIAFKKVSEHSISKDFIKKVVTKNYTGTIVEILKIVIYSSLVSNYYLTNII